jgi:branched-subunit amino acid transport protein AzlD
LNSYYNGLLIGYAFREQVFDLLPYFILSIIMGIVAYAAGLLQFPSPWALLLVQIITGTIIYVCLCRVFRLKAFMEMWNAMWNRMPLVRAGSIR